MKRVRWGVLSTAKIGTEKVIPAMQRSELCEMVAIASRSPASAQRAAQRLGLARAYGTYEELLADAEIDAVYIPLPNHMHVPWSIRTLEAGKHVLCEKPIGLSAAEAKELVAAAEQHPRLKVMEGFMYRFHPQWVAARQLVEENAIGQLRTIQSFFSYFNDDAANIRNQLEMGGGGLMDIGCYAISLSRFLFDAEPVRVCGWMEYDPQHRVDRVASAIMEFAGGTSTFTCSTQLAPFQRVHIVGTRGRIEIEIPFNAPSDRPCRLWLESDGKYDERQFKACDQYAIQGDLFSRAILDDTPVPTPLSDAVANMEVIESIKESAASGCWV